MNSRGFLIIFIIIAFVILALLPPIVMKLFPPADLLMRIILAVMIFATVRGHLGSNTLTIIISAVLIYLLVIKHPYITASLYVFFYVLLVYNFLSVIVWGIGTKMGRHG